jgi:hypothetical protein
MANIFSMGFDWEGFEMLMAVDFCSSCFQVS